MIYKQQMTKTKKKKTEQNETNKGSANKKLLETLVCPITGGPLEYNEKKQELISHKAKLCFPIIDGIPIMLESEATPVQ